MEPRGSVTGEDVSVLAPLDPIWYSRARVKQRRRARTADELSYAAS
jgi:hypothetical protein